MEGHDAAWTCMAWGRGQELASPVAFLETVPKEASLASLVCYYFDSPLTFA